MSNKHEIEVEGLPDGYEAVAYRVPRTGERFLSYDRPPVVMFDSSDSQLRPVLIVKKKQPRRIVLEEIKCDYVVLPGEFWGDDIGGFSRNNDNYELRLHLPKTIWREVKETEEPNLCLGVEECEQILKYGDSVLPGDILLELYNYVKNSKNNNKTY